jgi:hypothetical protein
MKRDINVVFEGSMPNNYDRYLDHVLFEPFADDMAARLKEAQPATVLDLAADREFSLAHFGLRSRTRALSQPISIRE